MRAKRVCGAACSGWIERWSRTSGSAIRARWWLPPGRRPASATAAGSAGGARPATTSARAGGAGGRSISAPPAPTSTQTPRGSAAAANGVTVCAVPWARHDARLTRSFEDQVAWLAVNSSRTAVAELMRISWRTVGRICERVGAEAKSKVDLLADLRRIGIDEISHRKGQRYLTVVVDHDSGRLVWAAPGREKATVEAFFDALGARRAAALELISCDMAGCISSVLDVRCPRAERCVDPFHVIQLATEALDEIRREVSERGETRRPERDRARSQGRPLRALEEPREPDLPPAGQARSDRADQPAALPRLPAERAAAPDLPAAGGGGDPPSSTAGCSGPGDLD